MKDDLSAIANFAARMTREAGGVAMRRFRKNPEVENKKDNTAVTAADRECETHMRENIAREYPGHGIVGEEFGAEVKSETWALDPIDGTLSFITGSPLFCVLAAFLRDGVPVVGIIHLPATGDTWSGILRGENSAATFNRAPCRVSGLRDFRRAVCAATTVGWKNNDDDARMGKLLAAAARVRLGGDGFNYGCVASGFADAAADYDMAAYDYLAPAAIVAAAGGKISDWQGNPLTLESGRTAVLAACSEEVHRGGLAALNS